MPMPILEVWSSSVRLTAWQDEAASERQGYPVQHFKVEPRCKNSKGDWFSSPRFLKRDLLDLAEVCRAAYVKLSVKERNLTETTEERNQT